MVEGSPSTGPSAPSPARTDVTVVSDPAALSARIRTRSEPVPVDGRAGALTLEGSTSSSVTLTLSAELDPPTVDGMELLATSVHVSGSYAFVAYAELGEGYGGAVDVIDLTDPTRPSLSSQVVLGLADVNAVYLDGGTLYLAEAGEGLGFDETAAVHMLGFDAGLVTTATNTRVALAGYVATSVTVAGGVVYATSGTSGGLYALDRSTLAPLASVAVADARWVDSDGTRVVVHEGDSVGFYDATTLANPVSRTLTASAAASAKARVFLEGGKAFITASENGLEVISATSGTVHQTLPAPSGSALGVSDADVQMNAAGYSGSYVFMAYGAAGASVARSASALSANGSETHDDLEYWGRLLFSGPVSANDVDVGGTTMVIAAGAGGAIVVSIAPASSWLELTGSPDFDQVFDTDFTRPSAIVVADYNGDGYKDVIFSGTANSPVLMGDASGGFTQLGSLASVDGTPLGVLDGDDDGVPDIFETHSTLDYFENNGSGVFTDHNEAGYTGVTGRDSIAIDDVNGDGLDDVMIFTSGGNYVGLNQGTDPATFVVATATATGLMDSASDYGAGTSVASADVNDDGYLDVYYHHGGGRLFLSNGDGTFAQDARGISIATPFEQPLGAAFGDYDNDGDMDLFVPNGNDGYRSTLWRNDGASFTEVAGSANIVDTGRHTGACWGDYDNDGDLDLYVTVDGGGGVDANLLYRNQGNSTFQLLSDGLQGPPESEGCVFADYDDDGDLDLFVLPEDVEPRLYVNGVDTPAYLKVRPIGRGAGGSSRIGRGVRVELYQSDGATFLGRRELGIQMGGPVETLEAHFGGVTSSRTYVVKTFFRTGTVTSTIVPSAVSTTISGVTIPKLLTVTEP